MNKIMKTEIWFVLCLKQKDFSIWWLNNPVEFPTPLHSDTCSIEQMNNGVAMSIHWNIMNKAQTGNLIMYGFKHTCFITKYFQLIEGVVLCSGSVFWLLNSQLESIQPLSNTLYLHCLILISSRNRLQCYLHKQKMLVSQWN